MSEKVPSCSPSRFSLQRSLPLAVSSFPCIAAAKCQVCVTLDWETSVRSFLRRGCLLLGLEHVNLLGSFTWILDTIIICNFMDVIVL